MKVAVTGAGGYVGGRLLASLAAERAEVVPLVRRPVPWVADGRPLDLAATDPGRIAEELAGCDAVVHLAGASEVRAAADPDGALADTVAATRRVAAAAATAGVGRLVFLSTVHVYGAALADGAVVDETTVPEPRHPYAVARLAGEHLAVASGVPTTILRLTNSVGAPADRRVDRWTLVANDLCAQAAAGGPLVLRTSGRQWRDFVDLGDACAAIAAAARGAVPPGTFNLGSGRPTTVLELAGLVADAAAEVRGRRPEVQAQPHQGPVPVAHRVAVGRLACHWGYPSTPLAASLRETVECCERAAA